MTGGSEGSSRGYGMGRTGEGTYSTPFVGDTTPGRRTDPSQLSGYFFLTEEEQTSKQEEMKAAACKTSSAGSSGPLPSDSQTSDGLRLRVLTSIKEGSDSTMREAHTGNAGRTVTGTPLVDSSTADNDDDEDHGKSKDNKHEDDNDPPDEKKK